MSVLRLVNNSSSHDVWLELRRFEDEVRPQVLSLNPSGPYAANKPHYPQVVSSNVSSALAVFLFSSGAKGTPSYARIDVPLTAAAAVATIVTSGLSDACLYLGEDEFRRNTPPSTLPAWLRWTLFALVAAAILGSVAFIAVRTISRSRSIRQDGGAPTDAA